MLRYSNPFIRSICYNAIYKQSPLSQVKRTIKENVKKKKLFNVSGPKSSSLKSKNSSKTNSN